MYAEAIYGYHKHFYASVPAVHLTMLFFRRVETLSSAVRGGFYAVLPSIDLRWTYIELLQYILCKTQEDIKALFRRRALALAIK